VGSDSYPYEVIGIVSEKCLEIRQMKADGCLNKDMCDQNWVITQDPNGQVLRIRKGKRGWKSAGGTPYSVGTARRYYDPHF